MIPITKQHKIKTEIKGI